jgi:hypothetical protein
MNLIPVSVPSQRESFQDIPACQAAASVSGKATGRPTRQNAKADLPTTKQPITPPPLNESLERFCLSFSCMSNPFRSLSATTQIPHDIALSPQPQNDPEKGGIALNHPIDGRHRDGSQSRLRLDGQFIGSVALTVDRTLSQPSHLFNGIEVSAVGRPMKIAGGDFDADCTEWFFRPLCLMG